VSATLRAVAARIRRELPKLARVAERARDAWNDAARTGDDRYVDSVALSLHGYYAGLERVLEEVAQRVDETVPSGADWHRQLLDQMADPIPGIRPPVLSEGLAARLQAYRGFRHVVRNVYTYNLDPKQVERLVAELPALVRDVDEELSAVATVFEQAADDEET
jgi:hypothetical protein